MSYHVVLNTTEDGENFSYFDPTSGLMFWNLSLTNLTQAEVTALETLFAGCYGRWASFLFMDPTDNLLGYSADLTNPVWTLPPEMAIAGDIADPQGGTGAFQITNQSQVVATFGQSLGTPPNFTYAFSAFVRATSSGSCYMIRSGNSEEISAAVSLTTQWTRISSNGQLTNPGSSVMFGFQLQPGQQIQVFGLQCEAQPAASESYRPTYGRGGVYANAYFAMEALTVSADAPGLFSTLISIEATRLVYDDH